MKLREKINEFVSFVLSDEGEGNVSQLVRSLDELAVLVHCCEAMADAAEFPDPPSRNVQAIRLLVKARFPSLGFYNTVDMAANVGEINGTMVGDAIDDLVDIVGDLQEVEWRFTNTSAADAQWCFLFSFQHHWGRHLRDVQGYLHHQL